MPTKEDIGQMRSKNVSDSVIMDRMYNDDASFKSFVDQVNKALPNISAVERAALPTYLIDRHYLGNAYATKKKAPPSYNRAITAVSDSEMAKKKGGALLDTRPIEEGASLGGFAQNVLSSGVNLAKSLGTAVMHPLQTGEAIGKAALGGTINLAETITGNEQLFDDPFGAETIASGIGDFYKERYGSIEAAKKTAYEDPVGFAADVAGAIQGAGAVIRGGATIGTQAARIAAKTPAGAVPITGAAGALAKTAGKASSVGKTLSSFGTKIDPLEQSVRLAKGAIKGIASTSSELKNYAVSQVSGLEPKTVATILNESDDFAKAKAGGLTRVSLGKKVQDSIDNLDTELSSTGTAYGTIRKSAPVSVPTGTFKNELRNLGFKFDDSGKILIDASTPQLSTSEVSKLQSFLERFDNIDQMTGNEFLNLRESLTKLSKFEDTGVKSSSLEAVARDLRRSANETMRPKFKGLTELDAKYQPQVELLRQYEKEFINPATGELKDNAINAIANAGNKGKDPVLNRLKNLVPGIDKEIKILKAIEDVYDSTGTKVGTYARGALGGVSLATGNIPLFIAAMIASPSRVVSVLEYYGKVKGISQSVVKTIVNKLEKGTKLGASERKIISDMINDIEPILLQGAALSERADISPK